MNTRSRQRIVDLTSVDVTPTRVVPGRRMIPGKCTRGNDFVVAGSKAPPSVVDAQSTPIKKEKPLLNKTPTRRQATKKRASKIFSDTILSDKATDDGGQKYGSTDWDIEKAILYIESPDKPLPDEHFTNVGVTPITKKIEPVCAVQRKQKLVRPNNLAAKSRKDLGPSLDESYQKMKLDPSANNAYVEFAAPKDCRTSQKKAKTSAAKKRVAKTSLAKVDKVMKFVLHFYNDSYVYILTGCEFNSEDYHIAQQRLAKLFTTYKVGANFSEPVVLEEKHIRRFKYFMYNARTVVHTRKFNPNWVEVSLLGDGPSSVVCFGHHTTVEEIRVFCEWLFGCHVSSGNQFKMYIDGTQCLRKDLTCAEVVEMYGKCRWYLVDSSNIHLMKIVLPAKFQLDRVLSELHWVPPTLDSKDELLELIDSMTAHLARIPGNFYIRRSMLNHRIGAVQDLIKVAYPNDDSR